jgi:hypothetical protein
MAHIKTTTRRGEMAQLCMNDLAYDPLKTEIYFDGNRVVGFGLNMMYSRGEAKGTHFLFLQSTSVSLPNLLIGVQGVLELRISAGGSRQVVVKVGDVIISDYVIDTLSRKSIPEIRVVLKEVRNA